MCKFENIINRFFKKKQDDTDIENDVKINYDNIVNTLESWEDVNLFKKFCEENNITQNRDDVQPTDDENYVLKVIASDLLYKLNITINHYHIVRINRIKEWLSKQEKK